MAKSKKQSSALSVDLKDAQVKEIRFLKKGAKVEFRTATKEEVVFKSPSFPHPDLVNIRTALAKHLLRLCEVPNNAVNDVTINGVAFKYDDGVLGAVIKGERAYQNSVGVLTMNSPVHYMAHSETKKVFDQDTSDLIVKLHDQALEYVGGKSSQKDLFEQAENEPEEEAAPTEA